MVNLWNISLDKAKSNFTNGLDYAKRKNLLWHPSGDYYPYPSAAWRLDAVPDPDAFNVNLSFAPAALYDEVKGDLAQLKSDSISNPVWSPSTGGYFNAVKLKTKDAEDIAAETKKCREAFVAGTIDREGYETCLARIAAKHKVD